MKSILPDQRSNPGGSGSWNERGGAGRGVFPGQVAGQTGDAMLQADLHPGGHVDRHGGLAAGDVRGGAGRGRSADRQAQAACMVGVGSQQRGALRGELDVIRQNRGGELGIGQGQRLVAHQHQADEGRVGQAGGVNGQVGEPFLAGVIKIDGKACHPHPPRGPSRAGSGCTHRPCCWGSW